MSIRRDMWQYGETHDLIESSQQPDVLRVSNSVTFDTRQGIKRMMQRSGDRDLLQSDGAEFELVMNRLAGEIRLSARHKT